MRVVGWVFAAIGVVLVVALLAVGVWQLGWFVEGKNVNKRAQINEQSYNRQQAIVQQLQDDIVDVNNIDVQLFNVPAEQKPSLVAQRKAIVTQACDQASRLSSSTIVSPQTEAFISKECN